MSESVTFTYDPDQGDDITFEIVTEVPGAEFDGDHNDIDGRDADDAHPMSAVTGLVVELDAKATTADLNAETIARTAEDEALSDAIVAEAVLARNADNLTSGTVADARIPDTIARDVEVAAGFQPLDSDLTAIAALSTTSFGRAFLALVDAGAARTAIAAAPATRTVGAGLGTTGTVDLDMASLHGSIQTIGLTGNPTFTTSNKAGGREVTVVLAAGGSSRTIVWPAWTPLGAALPTTLASGKTAVFTVTFTGTTEASGLAVYAAQP